MPSPFLIDRLVLVSTPLKSQPEDLDGSVYVIAGDPPMSTE